MAKKIKKTKAPAKKTRAPTDAAPKRVVLADLKLIGRGANRGNSKYLPYFTAALKVPVGEGVQIPLNGEDAVTIAQRARVALGRWPQRNGEGWALRSVRDEKGVYIGKVKLNAPAPAKKAQGKK